ncbi:hypothetical protein DUNSADRAFT_15712 [Dunaliella salina]|uniref:Uncharacterized protein n=1 Tax=Dunaliella salina TaxID=3046 RepID=A0ABQ7G4U6_DUNSA|nr:hypothetical protein DUNSADRAFT_15712 [Dunaliella salina]|eukprot:KAF5829628.1 hypothetical protein DUNSADRAFT_15712 [Dunaliella salina]
MAGEQKIRAAQADAQTPPKLSFQHYDDLVRLCNTVRNRLDAIGYSAFFGERREEGSGPEPQAEQRHLESSTRAQAALQWFAETAWRAAVNARRAEVPQACAVLLSACANMLTHHPHPQLRHLRLQRLAFVSAAASVLDVHLLNPAVRTALGLAKSLLGNSRNVAMKIQDFVSGGAPSGSATIPGLATMQTSNQQVERLTVHLEMVLAVRSGDQQRLRHLLFEDLPNRGPEERPSAQQMVEVAKMMKDTGTPQQDKECQLACYQLALQQLAVEQEPDLRLLPKVLRRKAELRPGDNDRLATFREASQIMGQLASQSVARGTGRACASSGGGNGARSGRGGGARSGGQSALERATDRTKEEMVIDAGLWLGLTFNSRDSHNWFRLVGSLQNSQFTVACTRCWNRGAHLSRLLRPVEASHFMRAGLALLNFMPASYDETYRPMMEDQLQKAVTASTTASALPLGSASI